jgi:hypothetical protein
MNPSKLDPMPHTAGLVSGQTLAMISRDVGVSIS